MQQNHPIKELLLNAVASVHTHTLSIPAMCEGCSFGHNCRVLWHEVMLNVLSRILYCHVYHTCIRQGVSCARYYLRIFIPIHRLFIFISWPCTISASCSCRYMYMYVTVVHIIFGTTMSTTQKDIHSPPEAEMITSVLEPHTINSTLSLRRSIIALSFPLPHSILHFEVLRNKYNRIHRMASLWYSCQAS